MTSVAYNTYVTVKQQMGYRVVLLLMSWASPSCRIYFGQKMLQKMLPPSWHAFDGDRVYPKPANCCGSQRPSRDSAGNG